MPALLDTSVLIGGNADVAVGLDTAISVISIAEMQFGVVIAKDETVRARRLARLSAIQRTYEPLPVDQTVAASYAEIAAATRRAGRKASSRTLDLLIAATAHAHGAQLLTANPADFDHLTDIVEIVPVKASRPSA